MKKPRPKGKSADKPGNPRVKVLGLFPVAAVGAEVGVFRGAFSRRIVNRCKPSKLFLIDPWLNSEEESVAASKYSKESSNDMEQIRKDVESAFASEIASGQVQVYQGFSSDILGSFADEALDFIYLDGDHRYDGLKSDLAQAMRVVKPGGVIAADDYTIKGWWKGDVIRAVNEFVGEHAANLQVVYVQGSQFVVRKNLRDGQEA